MPYLKLYILSWKYIKTKADTIKIKNKNIFCCLKCTFRSWSFDAFFKKIWY